jgi:hexosaminidase
VKLCEKHGYRLMIWSDMYFRLGSKAGDYYDRQSVVPDAVKAKIPKQVELVYWDYYHTDEAFYMDWIARHRSLGFEPIMGSGVWTWCALWHAANYTEPKAGACVRACRKAGLKEIFFTMWGDDGAMCDFDSAMAGLTYVAELAYAGRVDDGAAAARFAAICGGDYLANRLAGQLSFLEFAGAPDGDQNTGIWAWPTLWDDPLLGIYWNDKKAQIKDGWARALAHYRGLADRLRDAVGRQTGTSAGDLAHASLLADLLATKIEIRAALNEAYARRDGDALKRIVQQAGTIIEWLSAMDASYRRQWLRRNKPFGLEVVQVRIAGLIRRYRELADRIGELLEGRIDRIAELEDIPAVPAAVHPAYRTVSTACVPFD